MALDYSQKRLLSKALHSKNRRLELLAFWTGVLSLLISIVHLFLLMGE